MALPVTITGVTVPTRLNSYVGPFKAPNQQYYVVLRETTDNAPAVLMATDPTSSFTEQDASNNPTSLPGTIWAYISGSEIHIVTTEVADPEIRYHVFDTSSDTWTTKDETIEDTKNYTATAVLGASIAIRSDGDVIVLYTGTADSDMGQPYDRVDYARKEGASWTVGLDVGGTSPITEDRRAGVVVRGSADNMHLFWVNSTNIDLHGRTLNSSNSLSTTRTIDLSTSIQHHAWAAGISYNDAGTIRVIVPYSDDANEVNVARFTESSGDLAASPGTTKVSDGTTNDVATVGNGFTLSSAVDGDGRMYVVWGGGGAAGVDQDLYRDDAATPYTSWGTDTEELDGEQIDAIFVNIYPRDGAIKLAMLYKTGPTIKYGEVSITAPTAPTFANSRFPDQNFFTGPFKGP